MKGKIKPAFLMLIFCFVNFAFALESNTKVLTVEDAVCLAKENNISIKKAGNTLENLQVKNRYSWNSVSPTATVSGNFSNDFENNSNSIGITGSVNMGLKTNLYTDIQKARLNYEKGFLTYDQAVRAVELNVRKSFYHILYEQENLLLQKRSLETSHEQYLSNQEKFKNGKISELDAMQSRVNYESKKPDVESAEITLKNDLADFKQVLGVNPGEEIELKGSLDDVLNVKAMTFENLPKVEKPAPDVQSAEYDVQIAKNSLLDSKFSAYAPSITGSYSYGKTKKSNLDDVSTTNSLSVGVSIPLDGYMPWSAKAVNVGVNRNELENAELNLENAKTTVAVQTEGYLRKINLAVSQVSSLMATEELARQTYEMSRTAYNYGKTDLNALQNASDSVLSAGVNLKKQAYTLISTILDLENVLGLEFGVLCK